LRIWFDADNAPHVLVMRPLAEELLRRGHEVFFTARDRSSTCGLLDLYHLPYEKVGGRSVTGMAAKVLGTLVRALALARTAAGRRPAVSFGHGSRALPIASRIIGIPSVTMYDYEWVDPRVFNRFCTSILLPEAIDGARCAEAGIALDRVRRFPGYKEQLYLAGLRPDDSMAERLGLASGLTRVLLRPPASEAHYHNPASEAIYGSLLERLGRDEKVRTVLIPRNPSDVPSPLPGCFVVPGEPLDGPSLVWAMDLVIGGGGTMTREAAVLGVPSASFFIGKAGRVDEALTSSGRLVQLRDRDSADALEFHGHGRLPRLDADPGLADSILSAILDASGRRS